MKFRTYAITALIAAVALLLYFEGGAAPAVWGAVLAWLSVITIRFIEKKPLGEILRRMRFIYALFLRILVQMVVIYCASAIGIKLYGLTVSIPSGNAAPHLRPFLFGDDILWIVPFVPLVLLLVNMIRQMSRMLGQNVLFNMVMGTYIKPIEEDRIFMFLDLDASTTIAEKLGNIEYHNLLDEYVYDITRCILDCKGEIYQYVGDEVVVTWPQKKLVEPLDCIDCFFRITETMERYAERYRKKYGFVPGFKAGFHCGRVVTGQIGDIKKEIVFQGDVVNTASRIKETCSSLGVKMLLSRELLDRLSIENSPYKALRVGSFLLKGKEHEVELFTLTLAG